MPAGPNMLPLELAPGFYRRRIRHRPSAGEELARAAREARDALRELRQEHDGARHAELTRQTVNLGTALARWERERRRGAG